MSHAIYSTPVGARIERMSDDDLMAMAIDADEPQFR